MLNFHHGPRCLVRKVHLALVVVFVFSSYWLYYFLTPRYDLRVTGYQAYIRRTSSSVWKHPFEYVLQPSAFNDTAISLVVLITSRPNAIRRRRIIRETWAGRFEMHPGVRVLFVTGQSNKSSDWDHIRMEADAHGDLIVAKFDDTYFNLSIKTFLGFKYVLERYPVAELIIKADDDAVLFTDNILEYLRKRKNSEMVFFCHVFYNVVIIRGKWSWSDEKTFYVPYWLYPQRYFPHYCSGHAYAATRSAVRTVVQYTQEKLNFYLHIEDALFTGLIAEKCNVSREHSWNWHCCESSLPNYDSQFSIHFLESDEDMIEQWKRYEDGLKKMHKLPV